LVLLRFTKLIAKVLDHSKKHTIRRHTENREKYPLKAGQTLQCYLLFKIGDAKITKVETKQFAQLNDGDAKRDGFKNRLELCKGLRDIHDLPIADPNLPNTEWDLISFEPEWPKMQLIEVDYEQLLEEISFIFETFLSSQDDRILKRQLPNLLKLYKSQGDAK
jgi:hypothetical protein